MAEPFITRDDLANYLDNGATDLSASNKALIAVDYACDTVRTISEQTFNFVQDEEIFLDGTGTDCLLLPQLPVTAAGTVIENVGSDAPGTLTLGTDYKFSSSGELYRLPGVIDSGWSTQELRTYWWPGRRNIRVVYSHGYDPNDVPRDVRGVALALAARHYQQESGVVFESLGQHSIRWAGPASDLTTTEKLVLDKYRVKKGT